MLSELEKHVIAAIQEDLPITGRPYVVIAEQIGVSEAMVLETLQGLCDKGVIRRFGATLRHQKSGFSANAMGAWRVPEARIEAVGRMMAECRNISHCYRRDPTDSWPYNLYTMIHATDPDSCRRIAEQLAAATDISEYRLLFSRRELKKTSMKYFPDLARSAAGQATS